MCGAPVCRHGKVQGTKPTMKKNVGIVPQSSQIEFIV